MWPRQIASDLSRFHHRRIADWHHGVMSSYELLELFGVSVTDDAKTETRTIRIDFAPDDGELAKAMRDGERPEWQQMLAQTANETAVLRAAYVPDAQSSEYGSRLFFPIPKMREFAAENDRMLAEQQRLRDEGLDDVAGMAAMWTAKEVN